jgi:hypothetical protein
MPERILRLFPRRTGAAPIVPEKSVAGRTLLLMITIMSFLSAVTRGRGGAGTEIGDRLVR